MSKRRPARIAIQWSGVVCALTTAQAHSSKVAQYLMNITVTMLVRAH
jgi:hypothetical protein